MEFRIPYFREAYNIYTNARERNLEGAFGTDFKNLDVKLRLAFGIKEIILDDTFVSKKTGKLKECHKLYYKLADLWFAYEAFIKFHNKIIKPGIGTNKIMWLDLQTQTKYNTHINISTSLAEGNNKFRDEYATNGEERWFLASYLKYCEGEAEYKQKERLKNIVESVEYNNLSFTNTDLLTMAYAVRNNFAHNGETTIAPEDFDYSKKLVLLKILYEYLAIVLLTSINITCNSIANSREVNSLTC